MSRLREHLAAFFRTGRLVGALSPKVERNDDRCISLTVDLIELNARCRAPHIYDIDISIVIKNVGQRLLSYAIKSVTCAVGGEGARYVTSFDEGGYLRTGKKMEHHCAAICGVEMVSCPVTLTLGFDVEYDDVSRLGFWRRREKIEYTMWSFQPPYFRAKSPAVSLNEIRRAV